jgi:broad specificity phosphatase PhoE
MRSHTSHVLILIRHGQSTANVNSLLVGRIDAELTERGREQATALAYSLEKVEKCASSPLRRARDTAQLAMPHLDVEIDEAFIELDYGRHDGSAIPDVPASEWREFRESHSAALGGGESFADLDQRVHARLEVLRADKDSLMHDPTRHLAVVSHVSPIKSAVAWALGVHGSITWRLRLDNASLTTIAVRDSGPYLVTYNDVSARGRGPWLER